jgi:hypothetical protein
MNLVLAPSPREKFRLKCCSYFAAAEHSVVDHLRKEELINCTCGFMEEDGLMIQVMYYYN